MKTISARDFRNAFCEVMKAEHHAFRMAVGFELKSYTYFMHSNIFTKIAKLLGLLQWNKDYHGLDRIFYEERGTDLFDNYTTYAKWISVALEHENKASKSHERISKLQMLNAPLKVLITYAEGAEADALLRKYQEVIRDADIFGDIATTRQQLVIFGTPKTVREWQFYVYERSGFTLMLPGAEEPA